MAISRRLSAALLATVLATSHAAAQTPGSAADRHFRAQVDSIANSVLAATGVPGASVAVVRDGRIAYVQAYGIGRLPGTPASTEMRYAIGSVSKQFTAAALLLLQEEGKLDLDDAVGKYVPGLTRGNDVTIRQILAHTSGYSDFWPHDYVPPMMWKRIPPQAILDRWARAPLDFGPGTEYQYSNTGYTLAGLIVEAASGMAFFDFLRTRILQPAGLGDAVDFDEGHMTAKDAQGLERFGLGPLRPATPEAPGWMYAAGMLAMTARDLARWDSTLIHQTLLKPESYREMATEYVLENGTSTGYGLGLSIGSQLGRRTVAHGGEVAGFTSSNIVFPDDSVAIVVLVNEIAASAAGPIARGIAQLIFPPEDSLIAARTARARAVFEGLQRGEIDRSLLTENAKAYFTEQALADFRAGIGKMGAPKEVVYTGGGPRGGMISRSYRVTMPDRRLSIWTFEMPDGRIEQFQVVAVP